MHIRQVITLGILLLLLAPLLALAQFPQGGGKGKGGKGGKGFGGFGDPTQLWDMMAQGKNVISRNDITNPGFQKMFDRFAATAGSSDGTLSRDQFISAMSNFQNQKQGGMGGMFGGKGKKNKGGWGGWGGMPATPVAPTQDMTAQWDREAEAYFRQADLNGDGKLNEDELNEMDRRMRPSLAQWDGDKDGQIDLAEFKLYYRDRMTRQLNDPRTNTPTITTGSVDDDTPLKRPDVFRYGNMPKNMPAWFTEYDTDQDGQVGLYEWRRAGKSLVEFKEYDRNEDGFITADEVIRWMAKNGQLDDSPGMRLVQNESGNPNPPPAVFAPPNNPWANGGMQKFGGKKGKGGGKGGKGGKRGGGGEE
jgi:Ca2+-binding EF-hand superfamily protein